MNAIYTALGKNHSAFGPLNDYVYKVSQCSSLAMMKSSCQSSYATQILYRYFSSKNTQSVVGHEKVGKPPFRLGIATVPQISPIINHLQKGNHCTKARSKRHLSKTSKMPKSGEKSSAQGRLTSTGLHPMRGVPPPERLVRKRRQAGAARILKDIDMPKEWQAGVSEVESCSLADWDGGRGLKTIFPKEGNTKSRCNLLCTGDTSRLTVSLEVAERHQDPVPRVLHRFDLPSDDDRIGIRLYDVDVSMEIRENPRNPKHRKSKRRAEFESGQCWVVHLETSMNEQILTKAKRMLRRLEAVTTSMPPDWFTYRNYLVKDTLRKSVNNSSAEVRDGVFTQTFVGGYTWRFTGNLASQEFQKALWGNTSHEEAEEEIPTRAQPYRSARGKKAAKKIPGKQRRLKRVQQRSMVPDESSQETPERMEEQKDESEQPQRPERSSSNVFSSESDLNYPDSDESGKPFEIEGLLDKRIVDDVVEYEVQWTVPFAPSWQPAANITAEAIAEFEKNNAGKAIAVFKTNNAGEAVAEFKTNNAGEAVAEFKTNNAGKAKKDNAKRGRPKAPKKTQVKKPSANAPRTRSATKAAQQATKKG